MTWFTILRQGHIDVAGARYDLGHLLASSFTLAIPASPKYPAVVATVRVEYTSHCVSFGPNDESVPFNFEVIGADRKIVDHRRVARAFCFDRHRWSLQLPAIIAQLQDQRCYFTGHSNWLVIEDIQDDGVTVEYEVFFRLRHIDANTLRLIIESAYVRDPAKERPGIPSKRRSIVRFRVMAAKTLRGEPIRDPNHNRR